PPPALRIQDALGRGALGDAAVVPDRPGAVPADARGKRPGALRSRLRRRIVPAPPVVLKRGGSPAGTSGGDSMRFRILCIATLALLPAGARAAVFNVRPGGDSKVVFTSKAPTETFQGKTDRMEGTLTLDPAAVGDSITVHLEVDLASLDTGKKMRNQHMRENHLETEQYRKAVLAGAAVLYPAGAKLDPGKTIAFQIEGTFALHGVSRRLRCPADATFTPAGKGGKIAFHATFNVALPDYQIKRPEFLFLKLAEVQEVEVNGGASSAP